jgi:hypothetical protein
MYALRLNCVHPESNGPALKFKSARSKADVHSKQANMHAQRQMCAKGTTDSSLMGNACRQCFAYLTTTYGI